MKYDVTVHYLTPKNTAKTKVYRDVEAGTGIAAKRQAKQMFAAGVRKPGYEITKSEAVYTPPRPAPVVPVFAQPSIDTTVGSFHRLDGGCNKYVVRSRFRAKDGTTFCVIENINTPGIQTKTMPESVLIDRIQPPVTTELIAVYPDGAVYRSERNRPISSSQYGVDQLIQIKVTKQNGKIIAKELVG